MSTVDTAVITARELLDVLAAQGVKNIVVSPGSRNAPLLIGVSARKQFKKYIINDERTAAFTALGIAICSKEPVVLICTSGTALYNYAPAVAEAYYQHVPLIVISADRPFESIGQESQTLYQHQALEKIVKQSFDIPYYHNQECIDEETYDLAQRDFANHVANLAFHTSNTGIKGPVHINIHFGGTFNKTTEAIDKSETKIVRFVSNTSTLPPHIMRQIAGYLSDKKLMVIIGSQPSDDKLNKSLTELSRLDNVCILADSTSNVHFETHRNIEGEFFSELDEKIKSQLLPDVVINIGGIPLSDNIRNFIKNSSVKDFWTLGDTPLSLDWSDKLSNHFEISPAAFLKKLATLLTRMRNQSTLKFDYSKKWNEIFKKGAEYNSHYLSQDIWDETHIYAHLFNNIPFDCNLFLSNGLTIRYANRFLHKIPHNCWGNRGVSGIEGTNATAFGTSLKFKGMTLLVTGDMSFAENIEILDLHKIGGDLRIVVINNQGGGIFRKIKNTRDLEIREEYFCSDPEISVEKISRAFEWNYIKADSYKTLNNALEKVFNTPKTIVEIKIPSNKI